jgi:hypothetical protein
MDTIRIDEEISQLQHDIRELRELSRAEFSAYRRRSLLRAVETLEDQLAERIRKRQPLVPLPGTPAAGERPGYARKRFLVLTDTTRCECVSLYKSKTGEPCGVKDAIAFAKCNYDDLDWDGLEQTIVEAWVKVPAAPPAPEVVEGEEVP